MEKSAVGVGSACSWAIAGLLFGGKERGLPEPPAPALAFLCSLCIIRGSHGQFASPSGSPTPSSSSNTTQILASPAHMPLSGSLVPRSEPLPAHLPASHQVPLPYSVPPRWLGMSACLPSLDGDRPSGCRGTQTCEPPVLRGLTGCPQDDSSFRL